MLSILRVTMVLGAAILILVNASAELRKSNLAAAETIREAPSEAHTIELNPAPGTLVYVNGSKCQ